MKKIIVFSRDPGAANVVIPIYKLLSNPSDGYNVSLWGKDYALKRYNDNCLPYNIFGEFSTLQEYENFLMLQECCLVITGTTSNDDTDRFLWKAAKNLKIPSIAILDSWMNYIERFKFSSGEILFPDQICVMDEQAKSDMVVESIPSEIISVTGQPYFETVIESFKNVSPELINSVKKDLRITDNQVVITFASEPMLETYGSKSTLGYDQFTILDEFISALREYSLNEKRDLILLVKLHPRNVKDSFQKYKNLSYERLQIVLVEDFDTQVLVSVSDLVVGMASMMLIEAALAGKPIESIQIGLTRQDPFVLSRLGVVQTITSSKELYPRLVTALNRPQQYTFDIVPNAAENIVKIAYEQISKF